MKKLFCALLAALLIAATALTVFAAPVLVQDDARLLEDDEMARLEARAAALGEQYAMSIVIVTVDDFGGHGDDIYAWANRYYSQGGYGTDGILLTISMAERDWYITVYGAFGELAFDSYCREFIGEEIKSDLSDGDYYDAFDGFLSYVDTFAAAGREGTPYSADNKYFETEDYMARVIIAFVPALVLSLIIVFSWKRSMNTRRKNDYAAAYVVDGSFELTRERDAFLYSRVKRTAKQSSSSGGGSSSSGNGSRGKF